MEIIIEVKKYAMSVFVVEMIGTLIFSLMVNLNDGTHMIGFSYAVCIFLFYEISGGHYNPAVSVGVFITTRQYSESLLWCMSIIVA